MDIYSPDNSIFIVNSIFYIALLYVIDEAAASRYDCENSPDHQCLG